MSDSVFPILRGLTYPIYKSPNWKTLTNRSLTGQPRFLQLYTYPYYTFKLSFSYLEDDGMETDDIQTLLGFYNTVGGAGQDFLFADPLFEVNYATSVDFGQGDGSSTSFRLMRTYGGFLEPVYGITSAPTIVSTVSGTATTLTAGTDFTWNTQGLITFTTAPVSGAVLTWSGYWYYRCHFANDSIELQQIFYQGWGLDSLTLESIKLE